MDSHEKLGNLLSQYLTAERLEKTIPQSVLDAFHNLGLTEYASRENVDVTYLEKKNVLTREADLTSESIFAKEYASQQIKELDDAYKLISDWLTQS